MYISAVCERTLLLSCVSNNFQYYFLIRPLPMEGRKRFRSQSDAVSSVNKRTRLNNTVLVSPVKTLPIYFKTECWTQVKNTLEELRSCVHYKKPIDDSIVLPLMCGLRTNKIMRNHALYLLSEVLSLMERYQCRESRAFYSVFFAMHYLCLNGFPERANDTTTEMLRRILSIDFLQSSGKFFRYSFHIPFGSPSPRECKFDLLWNTVMEGNCGLVKKLLRFGTGLLTPENAFDISFEHILHFM